jgi:hypothetical protein
MSYMHTHDRRTAPRVPFVAAVRHDDPGPMQLAIAEDLGPTGMRLRRVDAERGPCRLAFDLSDGGALVEVDGEIVFDGPAGVRDHQRVGVRFLRVSSDDAARIARFVAERLAERGPSL